MKKSYRVKKEKEFQAVIKKGKSCANRNFVVYTLEKAEQKHFRVGLSVGKKIGNAVARNRVKRKIRECLSELSIDIKAEYDFIIIARINAAMLDKEEMKRNIYHVLQLAKLLKMQGSRGKICEKK